jgi:hypothetical protein
MATFTASQFSSNVKAVHTGIVSVGAALSLTETAAAASVILLNKVPHGATLVDFWIRFYAQGADAQTLEIGTSDSPSGIMQITSMSQTFTESATDVANIYGVFNQGWLRAPGGTTGGTGGDLMPVRISLSDDLQPAEVWIQLRIGVAISASMYLTWCLFYTMDGMGGHTTIR